MTNELTETTSNPGSAPSTEPRKPYIKPEITLELELETRAGSPLMIDPLYPFGLDPDKP